jgi:hypothetical protein
MGVDLGFMGFVLWRCVWVEVVGDADMGCWEEWSVRMSLVLCGLLFSAQDLVHAREPNSTCCSIC